MVRRPARPLEHLAVFVRPVLDLEARGERLDLFLAEVRTALLAEIAEGEILGIDGRPTQTSL